MIVITEGSLTYTFEYDNISAALHIICGHTYGYKWQTIISDTLVTASSQKDNTNIPPKKLYDFVESYKKKTLHELIKIEFQKEPKGLGNLGSFESAEYREVPIVINIKIGSVMGTEFDQFSYISLLPDTSITPENINNNRISGLEKNITDIIEKLSTIENKCGSLDRNTEDTKKVFLSAISSLEQNMNNLFSEKDAYVIKLKEELDANKATVAALKAELDVNKASVATLKAEADANKAIVATLKAESDANKAIVAALRADSDANKATVDTLVADVIALKAPK